MPHEAADDHASPGRTKQYGASEADLSKPTAAVTQGESEVDEFGLRIRHSQARLYDLDDIDDSLVSDPGVAAAAAAADEAQSKELAKEAHVAATEQSQAAEEHDGARPSIQADRAAHENAMSSPKQEQDADETDSRQPSKIDTSVKRASLRKSAGSIPSTTKTYSAKFGSPEAQRAGVSEWSHMQLAPKQDEEEEEEEELQWQEMPAFATHTIYDDWGKVLAKEESEMDAEQMGYSGMGGQGRGYTKVQLDEDAKSATSMDDDTAYLFKQAKTTTLLEEDEEGRDMLEQMQATKDILTEGQRIAYVGVVKISTMDMYKSIERIERSKGSKKFVENVLEALQLWSQKMMVRLYGHMDISTSEQVMIEQLAEHGVQAADLTPPLMQNARVKNPAKEEEGKEAEEGKDSEDNMQDKAGKLSGDITSGPSSGPTTPGTPGDLPPAYDGDVAPTDLSVRAPTDIADQKKIDIDLRWTVLCDLFLVLVADSNYDARSRTLLEHVGKALSIDWVDICRFEKRITDALEMQEAADREKLTEDEHMEKREKSARNRKLMMMGLATVGGGLVIGLSAGLLAPVIGAGFAAGFATFGVAGTGTFFGSAGAAALITSTGIITGANIGIRASSRRMGAVKTFEYRPLHNNKRVNMIVTIPGWMTGKVDDVRLPFSTVDPIMGDMYSVLWEPEMLQSMGQTINILATEALTQGLQQILGSTILITLMAALQLPIVLTKLSYLIDNPWNVSLARADQAGLILADSLMEHNLGNRPITLCGFSIGSRVIYACLKELARKNAYGLIQNVYLFGSPMVANKDDYIRARAVVSGRFLNGYATNDWILGYLFRATSGGIMRVAGLAPVEVAGIENVDCTEHVPGHMSYRTAMPRLLRDAGWAVESLEFSEIEDPDPENHEKRQRELINEIEEARKELEGKKEKKGGLKGWLMRKRAAEKKEWETYDERAKAGPENGEGEYSGPVLFDVEAIAREVAELAAEGIEIREIESTLPPMRLDATPTPISASRAESEAASREGSPSPRPSRHLRQSSSYGSGLSLKAKENGVAEEKKSTNGGGGFFGLKSPRSATSWFRRGSSDRAPSTHGNGNALSYEPEQKSSRQSDVRDSTSIDGRLGNRPSFHSAHTAPVAESPRFSPAAGAGAGVGTLGGVAVTEEAVRSEPSKTSAPTTDFNHNAWAEEDEFGNKIGGEMEMSFE